ncbi:MAG: Tol-Pal system beta propeller repeat protein TolB, partial [Gammaproteobacteria bacterium]
MQRLIAIVFFCLSLVISTHAYAMLSMELTRGVAGAVPIAIAPFGSQDDSMSQNVSTIIGNDLKNSGRFKVYGGQAVSPDMPMNYYRSIGAENVVMGKVELVGVNRYQVTFKLSETFKGKESDAILPLLTQKFVVSESELRPLAHHISDLLYRQLIGVRGIFSTHFVYIVVQHLGAGQNQYTLEVSDADGYNPRPLLSSTEPIMSPAWAPNGRQIAYVSFENKHSSIYTQ